MTTLRQKNRPIVLMLTGTDVTVPPLTLQPNPQDITYTRPTRATVIQTLGGAWVDDFGEGVIEVVISGNTGWQIGVGGEARIHLFQDLVVTNFHKSREAKAADGDDPDSIKLILVDTLNIFVGVCYPSVFEMSKNVSSPLLWNYHIKLLVLDKLFDPGDVLAGAGGVLDGITDATGGVVDVIF